MFEWMKARLMRLLRVPHEPEPPLGAPGSVRIFRAGLNFYYLRLARWALGQAGAVVGIGFSLVFLSALETGVESARRRAALPTPSVSPTPTATPAPGASPTRAERRRQRNQERERVLSNVVARTPAFVMPLIRFLEIGAIALLLLQIAVTYAIVRLEFEQHWYIVTDRSLRIRTGIMRLQESTMSFANIQQVEIRQGPLQRLLGLADVCVRSAGGGGDGAHGQKAEGQEASLHLGVFEGVPNAVEIRDLVLDRLRRFREAGLGDPEDARSLTLAKSPAGTSPRSSPDEAVKELLSEARALRGVIQARGL